MNIWLLVVSALAFAGIALFVGMKLVGFGRKDERLKQESKNARIKDDQLDAATRRPRNVRELVDRLRRRR